MALSRKLTKKRGLPEDPFSKASDSEGAVPQVHHTSLVVVTKWLPLVQKLSINLLIPFLNGIMLGFGEIFAHELGVLMGWREARGFDPSSMPLATNPRARRRWLFGLY